MLKLVRWWRSLARRRPALREIHPPDPARAALQAKRSDLRWAVDGPPVGVWSAAYGTAVIVMEEVLVLRADGTGVLQSSSAMHGRDARPLRWEHRGAGALVIELTGEAEADDEGDSPAPHAFQYCTMQIPNEAGGLTAVLRNIDGEGFWLLGAPVTFIGEA